MPVWRKRERNSHLERRAQRKCVRSRQTHSTAFSGATSRRPLRNQPQNSPELLVPHVATVVAESVFVEVGLQVLRRDRMIDPTDSPLDKAPETVNGVGMNV